MDSVITQIPQPTTVINHSVITQVTKEGLQPNDTTSVATSGLKAVPKDKGENEASVAATVLSQPTGAKDSKKRPRRNFFCSILCCLGKNSARQKDKENLTTSVAGGTDNTDHNNKSGNNPQAQGSKVKALLPELRKEDKDKMCIVIDLDETLVHSSFKPISNADFIVPVEIDGTIHQVYVLKRPHVDEFLCRMGELFECVLFTASLAKYADPVADLLDKWDVFQTRLFRESCVFHRGNYVKDLSRLGRELPKILIVDNSPASYIFHPDNAVPCSSWFDDMNDRELLDLIPFLEKLSQAESVYGLLAAKFKNGGSSIGGESQILTANNNTNNKS